MNKERWNKIWKEVDAFLIDREQSLSDSRRLFVEWDLDEKVTSLTPEEILNDDWLNDLREGWSRRHNEGREEYQ